MRVQRHAVTALAALASAVALAGCGSSGGSGTTAASRADSSGIKFADCMRSHGVPNFPDPSGSGGGFRIQIGPGTGINPSSPSFQAASKACGGLVPGGGPGGGHPTAAARSYMLNISECMRAHGVSDFPDPTTNPPSGPSGYAQVIGRDGVFLAIPQTINVSSPAYQRVASVCHFGGPGGEAPKSAGA